MGALVEEGAHHPMGLPKMRYRACALPLDMVLLKHSGVAYGESRLGLPPESSSSVATCWVMIVGSLMIT